MLHPPHVQVLVDRLNDCLKAAHQAARSTCEDHLRTNRFGAWPDSAILSSGRDSNAGLPQAELENVAGGFLDNLENTKATAG
jgi:hypothetical protein